MRTWLADALELLGRAATAIAAAEGVRLMRAGDAFRTFIDQRRLPSAELEIEASLETARAALGEDFDAMWLERNALEIDEAIA